LTKSGPADGRGAELRYAGACAGWADWYRRGRWLKGVPCGRPSALGNCVSDFIRPGGLFMSILTSLFDAKSSRLAQQVNGLSHATAESLHGAACSIRRGSKAIESLAESTAGRLDAAGTYVGAHDAKRTIAESRQLVRRFPVESLFLAAGLGFLTGLAARHLAFACGNSAAQNPISQQ